MTRAETFNIQYSTPNIPRASFWRPAFAGQLRRDKPALRRLPGWALNVECFWGMDLTRHLSPTLSPSRFAVSYAGRGEGENVIDYSMSRSERFRSDGAEVLVGLISTTISRLRRWDMFWSGCYNYFTPTALARRRVRRAATRGREGKPSRSARSSFPRGRDTRRRSCRPSRPA